VIKIRADNEQMIAGREDQVEGQQHFLLRASARQATASDELTVCDLPSRERTVCASATTGGAVQKVFVKKSRQCRIFLHGLRRVYA
jgi:hypothetical protein